MSASFVSANVGAGRDGGGRGSSPRGCRPSGYHSAMEKRRRPHQIIALAAALLGCIELQAAQAGELSWQPVSILGDGKAFLEIDFGGVIAVDGYRQTWYRMTMANPGKHPNGMPIGSMLGLQNFDCARQSSASVRVIFMTGDRGEGEVVSAPKPYNDPPKRPPPGSDEEAMIRMVCGVKMP